jgi:RND family efflux transporter MFP subunit
MTSDKGSFDERSTFPLGRLRFIGLAAVVAAILVVVFGVLQRRGDEAEAVQWTKAQAIPTVSVISPKQGGQNANLVLPSDIQAWYDARIYARVSGYLKNWYFDYGAPVKKGDLLAEIDTPDLDAQLSTAQAKLNSAMSVVTVRQAEEEFAKTTYVRWRDSPKGVVAVQEQESKEADYNSAKGRRTAAEAEVNVDRGEVERLRALESFKRIVAPFDGIVTARETDIGALINVGSGIGPELFRVQDIHKVRIYVQVPQQLSSGLQKGLTANLRLPQYPDKTMNAEVVTTSHAINMSSRTLLVELNADNPDGLLQPGAYAKVEFALPSNPNVVRIPTSALMFREDGLKVATVGSDDKVEIKSVTLGRNLGTEVEVLHGLSLSDQVINSPPDSLGAGDRTRVQAAASPVSQNEAKSREH